MVRFTLGRKTASRHVSKRRMAHGIPQRFSTEQPWQSHGRQSPAALPCIESGNKPFSAPLWDSEQYCFRVRQQAHRFSGVYADARRQGGSDTKTQKGNKRSRVGDITPFRFYLSGDAVSPEGSSSFRESFVFRPANTPKGGYAIVHL